jgi:hypothetical protein
MQGVSQGQIGEYGNDRPLSICNLQTKGTAFSSLVAEVLIQIAKNVSPCESIDPICGVSSLMLRTKLA